MEPAAAEVLESLRRAAPRAAGGRAGDREDSYSSGDKGLGRSRAAPSAAAAACASTLRCLDKSHDSASCTLCTLAPGAAETNDYKLIAHGALKHGERTLRSQVVFSREWGCTEERHRLAEHLANTPGFERLASLLRRKDCAALRKADLITLARSWGYKSCIWVRKRRADGVPGNSSGLVVTAAAPRPVRGAPEGAPPPAATLLAAAPHALAAAALRERVGARHDALPAYVAAHLLPICAVARAAFQGRAVRAPLLAAAAAGKLRLSALAGHTARVQAWQPVAVSFAALVRAQHAAVAARLLALDAAAPSTGGSGGMSADEDVAGAPAWRALAATAAPGEEEFRTLYTMHALGDAAVDDIARASVGDEEESGGGEAASVWATEAHAGHVASLELAAAAGALLAHAKMGTLREYMRAAATLLELLCCYLSDCQEALNIRSALLADVARVALAAAAPPTPPAAADDAAAVKLPALATVAAGWACSAALPTQAAAAGGHFLRIWQSLLYHGVRPGLTAL